MIRSLRVVDLTRDTIVAAEGELRDVTLQVIFRAPSGQVC
jgi:hypothetical protein